MAKMELNKIVSLKQQAESVLAYYTQYNFVFFKKAGSVLVALIFIMLFNSCSRNNETTQITKSEDSGVKRIVNDNIETKEIPQIKITDHSQSKMYKKNKKYVVTLNIAIEPDSLIKYCEFSADSGRTYQASNVFPLIAGRYNFVARWKNDETNKDLYVLELGPKETPSEIDAYSNEENIDRHLPSQSTIQNLLNKLSNGDDVAYEKLNSIFRNKGTVVIKGAGDIYTLNDLMFDCNMGNSYDIQDVQIINNRITIQVSKN